VAEAPDDPVRHGEGGGRALPVCLRTDPGARGGLSSVRERLRATPGDGEQRRDFVAWSDVAQANLLATDFLLSSPPAPRAPDDRAFNVATGRSTSINELFSSLAERTGFSGASLRAAARVGDFAVHRFDVAKAREVLGFSAKVALEEGLDEVVAWLRRER